MLEKTRKTLSILALVAAVWGSAAIAGAQTDARFTGTVVDQSGATVAGATVTIRNERTGEERTARTNPGGRYVVANLRPSVYTVRATLRDFAPLEYTGIA